MVKLCMMLSIDLGIALPLRQFPRFGDKAIPGVHIIQSVLHLD